MKKLLLALLVLSSSAFLNKINAQNFHGQNSNQQDRTRTVYFFIIDLDLQTEAQTIQNYLAQFNGKIEQIVIDVATQMCTLEVQAIQDNDIEEIIFQSGFKAFEKDSLPPAGFKYVYNPDETWKLKAY